MLVAVIKCDVLKMSEKIISIQNISKTTLDFETKLKLKSLGPARLQLKIVQV